MGEYIGELVDAPVAKPKAKINPALVNALTPAQQVMPTQTMPTQGMPSQSNLSPKSREALALEQAKRASDQATAPPGASFMDKSKKLKDFEGYLTDYKNELNKDLMVFPKEIPILPSQGLSIPLPVGSDTARMNSKYTALLMGLKDAYELGALTGPDMSIVESQITNPATIAGAMTSRDAMQEQVKVLEGMLQRGKQNLESSYGKKMEYGAPQGGANPANDPLGLRPRKP
jgi:hypothetical protein